MVKIKKENCILLVLITQIYHDTGARGGLVVAGSIPVGVIGIFSVTQSFRSHYGPVVDSASNRNEYQMYSLGVKAAGA